MKERVTDLYTYPVKSLSPQKLEKVLLEADGSFPNDRAYALKNGSWGFDQTNPEYRGKTFYHVLMRDERLASLKSHFDPVSGTLRLEDNAGNKAAGRLAEVEGRRALEKFLKSFLKADLVILSAPAFSFSDYPGKVISIINLASVRALGKAVGADLDPVRFRGNIHIDGGAPWSEFDFVGGRFRIGEATLETVKRIQRCAAIGVDPKTAVRDYNLVKALQKNFGHVDMGIYARVIKGGTVNPGDRIGAA